MHPEELVACNRAIRGGQTLAAARNPPNRTNSTSGHELPPYMRRLTEGESVEGLADWFVARHTTDEALFRNLLSHYGFTTPGHEIPRVYRVIDLTQVSR